MQHLLIVDEEGVCVCVCVCVCVEREAWGGELLTSIPQKNKSNDCTSQSTHTQSTHARMVIPFEPNSSKTSS